MIRTVREPWLSTTRGKVKFECVYLTYCRLSKFGTYLGDTTGNPASSAAEQR